VEALEDRCLLSAGALDPTFGTGGLQTINFGHPNNYAAAVAVAPDGSVVMAGGTSDSLFVPDRLSPPAGDFAVTRLTKDGLLDTSFGDGGKKVINFLSSADENRATCMTVEADGSVIVAGFTRFQDGDIDAAVLRLTSAGQLDPSFGAGGEEIINSFNFATAVAVEADGSVVVAGASLTATGYHFAVAHLTGAGQLDPSFGANGTQFIDFGLPNNVATGVAVGADGSVVVAGYAGSSYYTVGDFMAVARLTSAGQLDPSFGVGGKKTFDFGSSHCAANGVALQPDGSVILAGYTSDGTLTDVAVARLTSAGQLDPTFGVGGEQTFGFLAQGLESPTSSANGVAVAPDGGVIVAGATYNFEPGYDFAVARLTNAGQLDPSFGSGGMVTTSFGVRDSANAVALQADGRVVAAGQTGADDSGATNDFAVARYLGDRVPTTTTVTDAGGAYNGSAFPATVAVTGAGTITGSATLDYVDTDTNTDLGSLAPTGAGHYTVTATYAGDLTHTGSSASTSFTIRPKLLIATASSQGTINIGSNGSIVLHLAVFSGQLYGSDTVASLFNGATFTIEIQKADGSVTYGTLTSTARVESDGSITVSMQMNNTLRADLYDAYVNGGAVTFEMTALANGGNYAIDGDTMSRLLNNGALKYVV
jgi:uncharacterized delta-60 repeat protein